MEYILHILILICIYSILSFSLDLLTGHTGLLSIAHAGFYGIGAYSSALVSTRFGAPFFLSLIVGMFVAGLLSFVVSLPSLRLHDDYFVIATFGFQIIIFSVFNNWVELTRGPAGITGIPKPDIMGMTFRSPLQFLILAGILSVLACLVTRQLSTSPFGRVLRAIREDEVFVKALGKNTLRFKVTVFAVSATLAALAGSLYAHYVSYIDPTSFTVMESILIISMVIIGGAGSKYGPLLGVIILVVMPEALRFMGLPSSVAAAMRQMTYGVLLVVMMIVRPRGLLGGYSFKR
jgi:branched-chain amino acid transport system permease protein